MSGGLLLEMNYWSLRVELDTISYLYWVMVGVNRITCGNAIILQLQSGFGEKYYPPCEKSEDQILL